MGQDFSSSQKIEISNNGRFLHLVYLDAYINLSSICYFQVINSANGCYMIFKLIDNKNDKHDNTHVDTITTEYMTKDKLNNVVSILTNKTDNEK